MKRRLILFSCLGFLVLSLGNVSAQQIADTSFYYKISKPAYQTGKGSLIAFDEFHNNPFSLKGQYAPFGKLLTQDGYVLERAREAITPKLLDRFKIYVTMNAMADPMNWDLPSGSAYSEEEVSAIYEWVKNGGSLFLITDHMPCGASANAIARKFGFNIINGIAMRNDRMPEKFSRSIGNLHDNVITNSNGLIIDSIRIWGGTAFIAPKQASIISSLDESYTIYLPSSASETYGFIPKTVPRLSGLGFANGAFMKFGKGRVVVFADGGALSAQLGGINSEKRGMNHPDGRQNAALLLNMVHWLDGQF